MPVASRSSAEALLSCPTLSHLLRARSGIHPKRLAYTFLTDGESAEENLTFAGLDRRARVLAAELEGSGIRVYVVDPGDMNTQMHREAEPGVDLSGLPGPESANQSRICRLVTAAGSGTRSARNAQSDLDGRTDQNAVPLRPSAVT